MREFEAASMVRMSDGIVGKRGYLQAYTEYARKKALVIAYKRRLQQLVGRARSTSGSLVDMWVHLYETATECTLGEPAVGFRAKLWPWASRTYSASY